MRRAAALHLRILRPRKPSAVAAEYRRAGRKAGAIPDLRPRSLYRRRRGPLFLYHRCLTASTNYPYSDGYHGSLLQLRGRNYLRNSVKAVVDAYNGSVTFYVFDKRDPIIRAYWQMLPGLFKDRSEMPENLQRHIR